MKIKLKYSVFIMIDRVKPSKPIIYQSAGSNTTIDAKNRYEMVQKDKCCMVYDKRYLSLQNSPIKGV